MRVMIGSDVNKSVEVEDVEKVRKCRGRTKRGSNVRWKINNTNKKSQRHKVLMGTENPKITVKCYYLRIGVLLES